MSSHDTAVTNQMLPDDGPPLRPGEARIPRTIRVDFTAVVAFRGIQASTVSVLTAGSGPTCGYEFKQGERYMVYATRTTDGTGLVTGICSRTRLLADAGEDLRFLQTLSGPSQTRARVFGTMTHWERDLATGQPREYGPVPDAPISVRGPASAFEARTDARGRYEVTVPPGKYEVTAFPPASFSAKHLQQTVELRDARACFAVDFGVQFDGRIRGAVLKSMTLPPARRAYRLTGTVVFEDGSPASGVFISLWDSNATWRQVAVGVETAFDGSFSFVVHQGLGYIANASYWDEAQRKQVGGSVGPFVVSRDTGPLKVVLSPR